MGLDAEVYAFTECDDEALAQAEEFVWQRIQHTEVAWDRPCLARATDDDGRPVVSLRTLARYYGPGYERGPWPQVYAAIRAVQAAFPGDVVRYASDAAMAGDDPFDAEDAEAIWAHWCGPKWNAYRQRADEWNDRHGSGVSS